MLELIGLLLPLFAPAPALALEGRVETREGVPVEHAWVATGDGAHETMTDARGRFRLPPLVPPLVLVVHHPRFDPLTTTFDRLPTSPLVLQLAGKQTVFEEIVVSAERGGERVGPVSVAVSNLRPAAEAAPPATLGEALERVPGVSESGQGGIFQVYSIRGVARQRVLTLFAGAPIVGERRAGVSASFLDPLLMGAVEVVRGPSSTYYGSGALGGVVQVFPRTFDSPWAAAGWDGAGDERYLVAGWGNQAWSLGLAHRRADDAEAPDGTRLNSHFAQSSASLSRRWAWGERTVELTLVPSWGEDIGKASTDFPEQVTTYPRERHLLGTLRLQGAEGWSFTLFAHPNDLTTRDVAPGLLAVVDNQSLDLGASGQGEWSLGRSLTVQAGFDYFARRGVTAEERRMPEGEPVETLTTLDDAALDDLAAFATARWAWGKATLLGGGRLSWERQQNGGGPGRDDRDDSAWNGFLGAVVPVAEGVELTANLGSGLRFPTLSERFFTGTTGRGGVVGNPDLEPERSLSADVGVRLFGSRAYLAAFAFHTAIDDYIERLEIAPDLLTYANLQSGTIEGFEVEGFWIPAAAWQLTWSGHWMEGEDDGGGALADVPAARVELGGRWRGGAWELGSRWQYRLDKDDPGSGEKAIPAAHLVSLTASYRLSEQLAVSLHAANLLDELYFSSADRKVSPSPRRSFGVGLRWSP
ncbi:MAG TPA: TonB-dependent receptor [Thermoanaerobaculia bacterium]|nr:TonB-dependent receptor [Thermoanaerobaculia bacterium]